MTDELAGPVDLGPCYVYHEKQEGMLCARHCLNNLLQGPYFSETDLGQIAVELDKKEAELMGAEYASVFAAESNNVDMDGNFSVGVLQTALKNLGIIMHQMGGDASAGAMASPELQTGFICNLRAHWFAVRQINGVWYDLNSLSGLPETDAKPTVISDFYLSAYLSTLQQTGYSIYVISGDYPKVYSAHSAGTMTRAMSDGGGQYKWYLSTDLKSRAETYPKDLLRQVDASRAGRSVGLGGRRMVGGGGMSDYDRAIQASLRDAGMDSTGSGTGGGTGGGGTVTDFVRDFMGSAFSFGGGGGGTTGMSHGGGGMGTGFGTGYGTGTGTYGSGFPGGVEPVVDGMTHSEHRRKEEDELQMAMALSMSAAATTSTTDDAAPADSDSVAVPTAPAVVAESTVDLSTAADTAVTDVVMERASDHFDEDEMEQALRMSMEEAESSAVAVGANEESVLSSLRDEPEADESAEPICSLTLGVSGHPGLSRRFYQSDTLAQVSDFIRSQTEIKGKLKFISPPTFHRDECEDELASLVAEFGTNRIRLNVRELS